MPPRARKVSLNGGGFASTNSLFLDSQSSHPSSSSFSAFQAKGGKRAKLIDEGERSEWDCSLCLGMMTQPFVTKCGHSFCFACISKHIDSSFEPTCPLCSSPLDQNSIFPNLHLNKVLLRIQAEHENQASQIKDVESMPLNEIDHNLTLLTKRKEKLLQTSEIVNLEVCSAFLTRLNDSKVKKREELDKEIAIIAQDLQTVAERRKGIEQDGADKGFVFVHDEATRSSVASKTRRAHVHFDELQATYQMLHKDGVDVMEAFQKKLARLTHVSQFRVVAQLSLASVTAATSNIISSIEFDRDDEYFATAGVAKRIKIYEFRSVSQYGALPPYSSSITSSSSNLSNPLLSRNHLSNDSGDLASLGSRTTSAGSSNILSLPLAPSNGNNRSVLLEGGHPSSMGANIGGGGGISNGGAGGPYPAGGVSTFPPLKELSSQSKISCLSWNSYFKERIANTDYEGMVSVWDTSTGQRICSFQEHEKRAWSVDFSGTNPQLMASGSDDLKVKLWSMNEEHSVGTIESKANVCCVRFTPSSPNTLCFGSADHHIHYYDIRNLGAPVHVLKGHAKAVSYVKFLDDDLLVSASTDSTLKLWSLKSHECIRTFTGHVNEKNFVGLTASKEFIACGSENNAVYAYYKDLSKPIAFHKFSTLVQEGEHEDNKFVSAVCWMKDGRVLLAANSSGYIHVMNLE